MATVGKLVNQYKALFTYSSMYEQRMRKLSCRIFNDFYIPEMKRHELDYGFYNPSVKSFFDQWMSEYRVWERNQERPIDLDSNRNHLFYPAHPQYRKLSDTLRNYGLYRDEHRDFREEMKKMKIKKGKAFRSPGGMKKNPK